MRRVLPHNEGLVCRARVACVKQGLRVLPLIEMHEHVLLGIFSALYQSINQIVKPLDAQMMKNGMPQASGLSSYMQSLHLFERRYFHQKTATNLALICHIARSNIGEMIDCKVVSKQLEHDQFDPVLLYDSRNPAKKGTPVERGF
jgi:hypothetical protein